MRSLRPHKNLVAWQESIGLVKDIYALCEKLPENEKFGISSQLKRAATSVPANIAEGAARNTSKEFIYFLSIANGSLSEIDTFLTIIMELSFSKESEIKFIFERMEKVGALINGLLKSLKA
jgi:four helix bundle protein